MRKTANCNNVSSTFEPAYLKFSSGIALFAEVTYDNPRDPNDRARDHPLLHDRQPYLPSTIHVNLGCTEQIQISTPDTN